MWATPATAIAHPNIPTDSLAALAKIRAVPKGDLPIPIFIEPAAPLKLVKVSSSNKPRIIKHRVKRGENLRGIAAKYRINWKRVWAKNKQLKHPDRLSVGQTLTMPRPGEKVRRQLPRPQAVPVAAVSRLVHRSLPITRSISRLQNTSGNTYTYGYCTWYVKNRRPDLPNNLGNANTWYSRAQAQGIPTGSTPRVGAVGMTTAYAHVVYIEGVNSNGTVKVAEMNYNGWNVVSRRTAPASEFLYIY